MRLNIKRMTDLELLYAIEWTLVELDSFGDNSALYRLWQYEDALADRLGMPDEQREALRKRRGTAAAQGGAEGGGKRREGEQPPEQSAAAARGAAEDGGRGGA